MTSVAPTTGNSVSATALADELKATAAAQEAARAPSGNLDKDAFLKLLVAQLKYQDPSKPMDSSEFMAQNAQLTALEKMTDLADTSRSAFATQQKLSAASLVGKNVSWKATDGSTSTGKVTAANIASDLPTLTVDGHVVPLDTVLSVTTPAA